ncbi:MAG: hypothetical protein JXA82_19340 [Sedimentisphaerales bacterium]|nr:hypothetical protein [Sedimentisphaerales bacterium]
MGENFHITLDPFTITIIFILLSAFVAAFIRGRRKDKCLKSFQGDHITLQRIDGHCVWGKLTVENTGIELCHQNKHMDGQRHIESSTILYKHELGAIQGFVRFLEELDENGKRQRKRELTRTYHPGVLRRLGRRMMNVLRTLRDSFVEVLNLVLVRDQKTARLGQVLSNQVKYVSQMKGKII